MTKRVTITSPLPGRGGEGSKKSKQTSRDIPMSRLQRGLSGLSQNGHSVSGGMSRLGTSQAGLERAGSKSFEELKRLIHGKLVDKLDLSRVSDLDGDTLRREIRLVVERLCDTENPLLNRMERERLIDEVLDETFGFGPLEVLLKDPTLS